MSESSQQFGALKMFGHAARIGQWLDGGLPPPVTVEMNVTNLCNHRCPGCSFSYLVNIDKSSLDFNMATRIISQLADFGVKAITFSGGGEPLVYGEERVLALVEQATNRGLDVGLITNGSRLTDERFLDLCQWIRVSLDGYDADTFARFHGRDDAEFARVVARLRAIGAKKAGRRATLGVGFLTDEGSVARRDLPRMAEFCADLPGLDYVQFRPLVQNMVADPSLIGGQFGDLDALRAQYQEARQYASAKYRVLWSEGKYHALAQPHADRTYGRCYAHFMEAVVAADAKVYVCCHTQGQTHARLGDLATTPFKEIWHSEQSMRVYESIDPRKHCPAACRLHLQNKALQDILEAVHPNFI